VLSYLYMQLSVINIYINKFLCTISFVKSTIRFAILGYDCVYSLIPFYISMKSVKFSKVSSNNLNEVSLK